MRFSEWLLKESTQNFRQVVTTITAVDDIPGKEVKTIEFLGAWQTPEMSSPYIIRLVRIPTDIYQQQIQQYKIRQQREKNPSHHILMDHPYWENWKNEYHYYIRRL